MPTQDVAREWTRRAWSGGDATRFATTILIVSELLCEAADIRAGQRVLDVAAGTGNSALAAARRNAHAIALDFVPSLLHRARRRSAAEALTIGLVAGNGESLPFGDEAFDAVLSTFGLMFVPDQQRAAAEAARVTRPGGTIAVASFTPTSLAAEFSLTAARFVRPPRSLRPPVLWGDEDHVRRLFADAADVVSSDAREVVLRFPSSAVLVDFFGANFGPMEETFREVAPDRRQRLHDALTHAAERWNRSGDGTAVVPFEYLEVVLRRR
jgi:SAM-dependent methyltransferase